MPATVGGQTGIAIPTTTLFATHGGSAETNSVTLGVLRVPVVTACSGTQAWCLPG